MRDHTAEALQSAKRLRREMSLPEVLLWRHLRGKPMGLKFRRQHPVGRYVADFYCDAAKTVIEVDGMSHGMGERPDRDAARDEWLKARGLRVLRIPATEVLHDPLEVAHSIASLCAAKPPPSALRAATSPTGEDLLE